MLCLNILFYMNVASDGNMKVHYLLTQESSFLFFSNVNLFSKAEENIKIIKQEDLTLY
jgi:hypothetical protein